MSSDAIKRILLIGESSDPRVAKQLAAYWHGGADHATLVTRGTTKLEHKARVWWTNMGSTVEAPGDLLREAEIADYVLACTTRAGDEACQVAWHLERLGTGWPLVSLVHPPTMPYPYAPGTDPALKRRR